MYNKIASIILNSAKAAGLSDVYVAQPDSLKENLAGKIFVLAEIGGKKNEGRKIFDFLVAALNDNYYNDDKILFRGKIEGLKIENIFEAAVTKTNKNLADFLISEKIRLNPSAANITIGVIYENKLHFANFGRNRALLIYRRGDDYEIINVEANASEAPDKAEESEAAAGKATKLFSSVISGEVPFSSYFIFASEALPEYLSGKEMINIVTKLPPITAAEQIKNVLMRMNTYVPFLGIIIKNTAGLPSQETKEEVNESLSMRASGSSLNYTEEKTEQMLAPAGLISFPKILRKLKELSAKWQPKPALEHKKYLRAEDKPASPAGQAPLDLGQIKSLNLARSDSFLLKEKIFFKKKPGWLGVSLKKVFQSLPNLFTPDLWSDLVRKSREWVKSLNLRNRWLFGALGLVILIFIVSLIYTNWSHERQAAQANFTNLVNAIEDKENAIDAHLLYNDEVGAGTALVEAQALLSSLPQARSDQKDVYDRLAARLEAASEKIQKIIKVSGVTVFDNLSGLGVNSLVYAAGKIYAAGGQAVYLLAESASSTRLAVNGAQDLTHPVFEKNDRIYYQDADRIVQFNIKAKTTGALQVNGLDKSLVTSYYVFNGNLYILAKSQNQIYRYNRSANTFGAKSDWLKEAVDLSQASDLGIDGDIYILKNDGSVLKFRKGQAADYAAGALSPAMTGASKLIVGGNYLYIFEASSKRLAVLAKKDGHLINQYVVDSLKQPKDLAVDEAGRAAYFLDGDQVVKISLNQ